MKRLLGLFLTFLGLLIILKSLRPELYDYLLPYAPYVRRAFWGVILIIAGLYVLIKDKTARTALAVIFILYLVLFLVTPSSYSSWRFSFRDAGEVKEIGDFSASEIAIENIAAKVTIERVPGNTINVLSNLPVEVSDGETLKLSCSECEKYENGKLLIQVGNEVKLVSLTLRNSASDVDLKLGEVASVTLDNVVGDISASGVFSSFIVTDFVGDMEVTLENCPETEIDGYCSQIEIYRGSGDIDIHIPENVKVTPQIEGSLTSVTIDEEFETGEKTLKLTVKSFIGKIVVE
ncbi:MULTISPECIES: hypothetical protein [Thermococcus]|uniref:Uncharacterized protein n=1 Tax=Thermococcus sibiricus (strain DSM 12597 / MM 739) TaxID=604354 RepID=C6A2H3_THESM|nr:MULTISPECIES: hypothetical protein [Thermococcus]ACS89818.1 hypothetical protein TSIB_0757 [Thermococcus sibiricus MM 739]MBC7095948.1 hypothetical protein [Thermococcus sp.]